MPNYVYLSSKTPNAAHLEKRVEGELAKYGYTNFKSSFLPGMSPTGEIARWTRSTDLIIADISDSDPNLFFELGVAFASKKPLILLVNKRAKTQIPSDLGGHIFIPYDDIFSKDLIPNILNVIRHTRS